MTHNVPTYFATPMHPISVNLVGCGGTGSQLLGKLAQLNHALRAGGLGLGPHPGLFVRVFDGDTVSHTNIGRQGFYPQDIGQNKAQVLVNRVNRAYGTGWEAIPGHYRAEIVEFGLHLCNILITCVDTAAARLDINSWQRTEVRGADPNHDRPYYWLDIGNSRHRGQVVLGTLFPIKKANPEVPVLPTILDLFPNLSEYDTEEIQGEACSVAEALQNQDLCINSMMAEWAKKLLWNLFKDMKLEHHGVFVNLETLTVNPIAVNAHHQTKNHKNNARRNLRNRGVRNTNRDKRLPSTARPRNH